jgi:hypothetical protein
VGLRAAACAGLVAVLGLAGCSDDEPGDLAAFCDAVGDQDRFEAVFDELDPTDVAAARATFEQARAEQQALRDLAPSAARGDIDVVLAFVDDLIEGLEPASEVDDQGRPSVYQSLRPRFEEVEAAGDRLRVYVESSC